MSNNSHVNGPILPKIKFVQDFMAVLIICKSDEDSIKNEIAIIQTTFFLKKVREKSRECHKHKPQSFPDPKRNRQI